MNHLISFLDLIGIVAFSASGALVAGRHNMDMFGALVLAFVTGIGGGTVRDLLLDEPVFWLSRPYYLWACLAGFAVVFAAMRLWGRAPRQAIKLLDAVGLAVFTVLGAQKTLALGHNEAVALIMGLLTGCGGGMICDVLANEVPTVLVRKRLYATASLAGGAAFILLKPFSMQLAMIAGFAVVLIIRGGALVWDWRLPVFPVQPTQPDDA